MALSPASLGAPVAAEPAAANPNVWSEYEIEAETSLTDRALHNLKHGDAFAVLDSAGNIGCLADTAEGLFYRDTRFLSHFELRLEGKKPLLLNSAVHDDKSALSVDLTNPGLALPDGSQLPGETIFIQRTKFLAEAVCYERFSIRNFTSSQQRLRIDLLFDADFRDLFEVRGIKRLRRGRETAHVVAPEHVEFHYVGLDDVERRTIIRISPTPQMLQTNRATLDLILLPDRQTSVFVTIAFEEGGRRNVSEFFPAYRAIRRARRARTAGIATVESSSELFNEVACRATSDLYTLMTATKYGPYPYAGIPWFSTVFGRDGIITAMLMLWVDATIAAGVLRMLAATQATINDPQSDAQPGKILHEMRHGEMANRGEVPFKQYYGSVDATPLFVMLAGMYLDATGDIDTIADIWPNVEAALHWIDEDGDQDGDGFVEYSRAMGSGLANQGWKDSHDAIFHADGSDAQGSIAMCEVQGYVFAAKIAAAKMSLRLGASDRAARLRRQAEVLRKRFEAAFWSEDMGTYVLGLDGEKRPCRVHASNAGHALFTGIASPDRARRVAADLMSPDMFSGWGIRTLAQSERRYNPMSYHNGSIWPHDNAIAALGLVRYGMKAEAARIFASFFDAAKQQELRRLPELFCGFVRRGHRAPTPYPVACSPQAWAAAALFGMLGACLGVEQAAAEDELRFRNPFMPGFLNELTIRDVRLGASRTDLRLHRYADDVAINVLARHGSAKILILK